MIKIKGKSPGEVKKNPTINCVIHVIDYDSYDNKQTSYKKRDLILE